MSSKSLFQTTSTKKIPTVVNHAGGRAYDPGAEHGLAQMAMTCTLADSYYTSGETQLQEVLDLCAKCDPEYVGKLAVYAREVGQMKDLPSLLTAYLASIHAHDVLDRVFARTIDNGRMVRNFFQIIRSGRLGRRGLGSQPKRLLRQWFAAQGSDGVFKASVGSSPSLADVIRMARPIPYNDAEKDMYRYLIGKGEPAGLAWQLKQWAQGADLVPSGLPFEFLAGAASTKRHWEDIAMNLSWNATLKNLNTFARHEIPKEAWAKIAERLQQRPPRHVFPYSIMTAFSYISDNAQIPMSVKLLVQKALDAACENVPIAKGSLAVLVDTSGSMQSPVTGNRGTASTKTQCVDVAALIASIALKKNPEAMIIPFDTSVHLTNLNPLDSVATNANILRKYGGGGTDVGCGLAHLVAKGQYPDLTIIVSDNESWVERWRNVSSYSMYRSAARPTGAQDAWDTIQGRNKNAKLVCLDIQANPTIQVQSSKRVLNLGGFSDAIWTVVKDFAEGGFSADSWVDKIKAIEL